MQSTVPFLRSAICSSIVTQFLRAKGDPAAPRSAASRARISLRLGSTLRTGPRLDCAVLLLRWSSRFSFGYQPSYLWYESYWNFHRGAFKSSFNFSRSFFITLRFVIFEHAANSRLIPSPWIFFSTHGFFLRLRRIARLALGPSSYAVITKTESGMGSVT